MCCHARACLPIAVGVIVAGLAGAAARAQTPRPGPAPPVPKVWLPGEVHPQNTRIYVHVFKTGLGHEHAVVGRVKEGVIHLGAAQNAGRVVADLTSFVADVEYARKLLGPARRNRCRYAEESHRQHARRGSARRLAFPTATGTITSARLLPQPSRNGLPQYLLEGELSLHGVTKKMSVVAEALEQNGWVRLRGHVSLQTVGFRHAALHGDAGRHWRRRPVGALRRGIHRQGGQHPAARRPGRTAAALASCVHSERFLRRHDGRLRGRPPGEMNCTGERNRRAMIECPSVAKRVVRQHYDLVDALLSAALGAAHSPRALGGPGIARPGPAATHGNAGSRGGQFAAGDRARRRLRHGRLVDSPGPDPGLPGHGDHAQPLAAFLGQQCGPLASRGRQYRVPLCGCRAGGVFRRNRSTWFGASSAPSTCTTRPGFSNVPPHGCGPADAWRFAPGWPAKHSKTSGRCARCRMFAKAFSAPRWARAATIGSG